MQDTSSQFDISTIVLTHGSHASLEEGCSLLEAVCLVAGTDFSDAPPCVDTVLAAFGRSWNNGMRSDDERAQLKQYITRLPGGQRSAALSLKLGWMAADWLIRVHIPSWLALSPTLVAHANAIRGRGPLASVADLQGIQPLLDAAKRDADAIGSDPDADWSSLWDAVRAAGLTASRDAATASGIGSTWSTAWTTAWAAAFKGVQGAAAEQLEPVVLGLQASAHQLFSAMIDCPDSTI